MQLSAGKPWGRFGVALLALAGLGVTIAAALAVPARSSAAPAARSAAAAWCGTVSATDRPATVGGRAIRVVYALASDGVDRSAEIAPLISNDVDEIDGWWRGQDSARTPRFDRAAFACGEQADIRLFRLHEPIGELTALSGFDVFRRVADQIGALEPGGTLTNNVKYLVYIDVPFQAANVCGIGSGGFDSVGLATMFLTNCTGDIRTSTVATHELLHSFGALPSSGPPHACPESPGHPCDSTGDILYLYAQPAPLSSFALDVGRDDYYGHSGGWIDIQDSKWLRHLDSQVPVSVTITGSGSVKSDLPGVDCTTACTSQWDNQSGLVLSATPAEGMRFVRWSGTCRGSSTQCPLTLNGPAQVTALFAPATFTLRANIKGKGRVALSSGGAVCGTSCTRAVTSFVPVSLRPQPATGWRFSTWRGPCKRKGQVCTVPMTAATTVTAVFVRAT